MRLLESMVIAFSMYSKVPMPRIEWTKENMRFSLCFFPLVGVVCGGLIYLWWTLTQGYGILFRSIGYTLIPVLVTGGIHMDGFLDTVDAISSWQPKKKRLEILKDPHAGAFAIIFCVVYFLATVAAWSEITDIHAIKALCCSFLFSRALSGYSVTRFTCAKNSGLAKTFADMSDRKTAGRILLAEIIVFAMFLILINIKYGLIAIIMGLLSFGYYRIMSYQKFGGITGDLAGFFLQICELSMLWGVMILQKVV